MFQGIEVARFIVRLPGDPAVVKYSDPFVGERPQCRLSCFTFAPLLLIEGGGPEGARDGECGPFDECLAQEGWALEAPMNPAGIAAALGNGRDAGIALQVVW